MLDDKEYERAIRFYLDDIFKINKISESTKIKYDTNVAKSLGGYIKSYSNDSNYKFDTPLSCLWNVTSACNFRCIHCLYNDTEYSAKNDLSHEQVMRLAESLINDFGITFVVLTGGEIFMRSDIMDIIRMFKSNNVAVRLQTNAALLNKPIIDEIAELFNPYTDSVHISLDGATEQTYRAIRQTDSFNKIVQNTRELTSKNVRVLSVCTLNCINYKEVVDMYKLCNEMGVYEFIIGKTVHYNDSHDKLLLSDKDLFIIYQKLFSQRNDDVRLSSALYTPFELLSIPEVQKNIENDYIDIINGIYTEVQPRNCHYHDKIAIHSDGSVYLCLEALTHNVAPMGNLKNNSLIEIWNSRFNNILFQERDINQMKCNICKYNKYCNSGCVAKSLMWSKELNQVQKPCNLWNY